ncbi:hypothetical protein GWN63_03160, partial [Candidatus Bathyarchaeota archaeon]|nr:hypothetical protein [Candidatus Bathyarchaeota archaeon]NIR13181.1 hypothetical protein [Desulfobacterales bacterium]NIU81228.1 hypothetical protein [Candidatus Bathyarchaeota archaeon]NIV67873.1 hypothetical protein [Candidatus Bathyarchaeota archaeon]NIW34521.1 hypothetical protein [Candidatus Bathyarchaeota archaeon]
MLGGATRKIWARRIRNFWTDFSHHKVGFAGSMVLIFFVSVGILAPLIAPEDPIFQKKVAARYAMPAWMKID